MWTGSWLAYGEILRNSAIGAARSLNKARMRPHVVRIASMGKGLTIETMGKGATTGNTGQGVTTMTTNEGIDCTCVASASDSFRIRGRAQWPVLYFSPEGTLLIWRKGIHIQLAQQRSYSGKVGDLYPGLAKHTKLVPIFRVTRKCVFYQTYN